METFRILNDLYFLWWFDLWNGREKQFFYVFIEWPTNGRPGFDYVCACGNCAIGCRDSGCLSVHGLPFSQGSDRMICEYVCMQPIQEFFNFVGCSKFCRGGLT